MAQMCVCVSMHIRVGEKDVPVFVMFSCQSGLLHGVV